jgi:hypothetical protein
VKYLVFCTIALIIFAAVLANSSKTMFPFVLLVFPYCVFGFFHWRRWA